MSGYPIITHQLLHRSFVIIDDLSKLSNKIRSTLLLITVTEYPFALTPESVVFKSKSRREIPDKLGK